jgi:glycosyltransferase involved in cell wall biosynthesis
MVPAYNEEKTIKEVVERVKELYPDFDVLVINDGSEDQTESEALKAGADVITLPFRTYGTPAVITGYLVALRCCYDYLVKIDGDGQHKPEDILSVLRPVVEGLADICVGSRYLENGEQSDSLIKLAGRVLSSTLVGNLAKNVKVSDVTSGFRAWNRRALEVLLDTYLNERSFSDDSVLWLVETIIASRKELKIKEVPISVLPRKYGGSKSFSFLKMLKYPLRLILLLMEMMR